LEFISGPNLLSITNYINTMSGYIQSNAIVVLPPASATPIPINVADSGKIHIIPAATAAGTISLPIPTIGLHYKFIMSAVAGFIITIASGTVNTIVGTLLNDNAGAASVVSKAGTTNFTFTATAVAGDTVEIYSDGALYYVTGLSRVTAGLA